ncbi:type II/IV secretion system protein, partial [Candidatus Sumerlaeota bacterium]|nr:type II/IV secretion system protein [Candidatus Sumerlaeota bacterium]
ANIEIRLPGKRSEQQLPEHLTQGIQITQEELMVLLQTHQPDLAKLCESVVSVRSDLRPRVDELIKGLETDRGESYRQSLAREVVTPEIMSAIVQSGDHPAARRNRQRLALEILALNGLISASTYESAVAEMGNADFVLVTALSSRNEASSVQIVEATIKGMALPTADLAVVTPDERSRNFCPAGFLRRALFLPLEADGLVRLATADPLDLSVADLLAIITGRTALLCYAPQADIIGAINRTHPEIAPALEPAMVEQPTLTSAPKPQTRPTGPTPVEGKPAAQPEAPQKVAPPRRVEPMARIVDTTSTVELVSSIIEAAVATRATDIHLEPQAQGLLRVRFRIDGSLHEVMNVPAELSLPVISRIKVLAIMNVTERRRPQDGHFSLAMEGRSFDFRVSAMPSHLGEKMVLRILEQATVLKGLGELGLNVKQEAEMRRLVGRPYGLLLVTGPTGSGKTTTLYSALSTINRPDVNITTIEDPVEYQLEGITQVQVDYAIELDFANGLRAALRQDPDVIMVGEVRDNETARIAIRAALTGHLVFSTLHTNTAVGAVAALWHMGIQPYLIASAMAGALAQRLVRRICAECKHAIRPSKTLLRDLGLDEESAKQKLYRGKGCSACLETG